jgi:carbon-monoxide dehydrogenase large subunit
VNEETIMRFGIGQPVTRKEDPRFLTGQGRYVADIDLARQAHAVFVFSPHAHAGFRSIDKAAAEHMPGVFAVLTGEEWAADGLGTLDPEAMPEDMGGPKGYRTKRPPLAQGRVRHVGERVAVVIAATEALARDAAELISVDYEVLPAVISAADAVRAGAPLIHDGCGQQHLFHDAHGQCRCGRCRHRASPSYHPALAPQQPRHCRHDGAARLHW